MPISSRRCGMITKREAERLCKSFLGDNAPPKLPENFAFEVQLPIEMRIPLISFDFGAGLSRVCMGLPWAIRPLALQFLSSQMYQMSLLRSVLQPQQVCVPLSSPDRQWQVYPTWRGQFQFLEEAYQTVGRPTRGHSLRLGGRQSHVQWGDPKASFLGI